MSGTNLCTQRVGVSPSPHRGSLQHQVWPSGPVSHAMRLLSSLDTNLFLKKHGQHSIFLRRQLRHRGRGGQVLSIFSWHILRYPFVNPSLLVRHYASPEAGSTLAPPVNARDTSFTKFRNSHMQQVDVDFQLERKFAFLDSPAHA